MAVTVRAGAACADCRLAAIPSGGRMGIAAFVSVTPVRLLLPVDGSDKDDRAIQVADAMAELTGGDIHVLRILQVPATQVSAGLAILGAVPEPGPDERATVERQLRDIASRLSSGSSRTVTWEVAGSVDVAADLLRYAEHGADIVILATRGPGTIERAFLGSVADVVVRKAPCPVIVVPPGVHYAAGARIAIEQVLVPLDGSRASLTAFERFLELVGPRKASYVLMQVVTAERTGGHVMPPMRESARTGALTQPGPAVVHVRAELAETHLEAFAARCKDRGDIAAIRVVESTDPAGAVVAAIRGELVDLIVMSTRGEGGVRRALHGSVANRVVRESEVPVFLVTPASAGDTNEPHADQDAGAR